MKNKTKIIISAVAAVCAIIALILIFGGESHRDISEKQFDELSCGSGVELNSLSSYSGEYFEDGSNEDVSGILQATVTNNGDTDIQFAYLRITDKKGNEYAFKITCLMRGETMAVLEENRAEYKSNLSIESARIESMAEFDSEPSMFPDVFTLLINGNFVTVINDDDVAHDNIYVCYKNYDGETVLGGITYRFSIPHLEPGESAEVNTAHFDENLSDFLFITYE